VLVLRERYRVKPSYYGPGQWLPVDADSFEAAAVEAWIADPGIKARSTVRVVKGSEDRMVVVTPRRERGSRRNPRTRERVKVGDVVRCTAEHLRSAGIHKGAEAIGGWTVIAHPGCGLCGTGDYVAVNQDSPTMEGPRHFHVDNLEKSPHRNPKRRKNPATAERWPTLDYLFGLRNRMRDLRPHLTDRYLRMELDKALGSIQAAIEHRAKGHVKKASASAEWADNKLGFVAEEHERISKGRGLLNPRRRGRRNPNDWGERFHPPGYCVVGLTTKGRNVHASGPYRLQHDAAMSKEQWKLGANYKRVALVRARTTDEAKEKARREWGV
jgi:hypothetical protein